MKAVPAVRSLHALDALNFFLADVREGIGPFLAVYSQQRCTGIRRKSDSPSLSAGSPECSRKRRWARWPITFAKNAC